MYSKNNIFSKLSIHKNSIAFIYKNKKISYQNLLNISNKLEFFFRKKSLVIIICKNNLETMIAYVATMRCNSVPILINKDASKFSINNIINRYKPEFIFCEKSYDLSNSFLETCYTINNYILKKKKYSANFKINPNLALLLSTSGTTGSSKYVKLSRLNLFSNTKSIIKSLEIKKNDTTITTLPLNYSYGMSIINTHLFKGSRIILTENSFINKIF